MENYSDENLYAGPERRKFVRIPFSFPIRFKVCGFDKKNLQEEGISQYAYSNNISIGGIQLKLAEKVKAGQFIKMKMTLPIGPDCKVLNLLGQILWTRKDEVDKQFYTGVSFIDMEEAQKNTMEEFIRESLKDSV
jgi:c-di-GMP-binding flagellar brake protein YcgR